MNSTNLYREKARKKNPLKLEKYGFTEEYLKCFAQLK